MKSLDQFVREELQRVARFKSWWTDQHAIDPKAFPLAIKERDAGQWSKDLAAFGDPPSKEWDTASLVAAGYVIGARVRNKADPYHSKMTIIDVHPNDALYLKVQGALPVNSTANDFEVMP